MRALGEEGGLVGGFGLLFSDGAFLDTRKVCEGVKYARKEQSFVGPTLPKGDDHNLGFDRGQ
jgi:hypothetical protein